MTEIVLSFHRPCFKRLTAALSSSSSSSIAWIRSSLAPGARSLASHRSYCFALHVLQRRFSNIFVAYISIFARKPIGRASFSMPSNGAMGAAEGPFIELVGVQMEIPLQCTLKGWAKEYYQKPLAEGQLLWFSLNINPFSDWPNGT